RLSQNLNTSKYRIYEVCTLRHLPSGHPAKCKRIRAQPHTASDGGRFLVSGDLVLIHNNVALFQRTLCYQAGDSATEHIHQYHVVITASGEHAVAAIDEASC